MPRTRERRAWARAGVACAAIVIILGGFAWQMHGVRITPRATSSPQTPARNASAFSEFLKSSRDLGLVRTGSYTIDLRLRNGNNEPAREASILHSIYNTSRPHAHFLTAKELASQYGPPESEVKTVSRDLHRLSLKTSWRDGQAWISVSGFITTLDRAFHARVHAYVAPDGAHYVASLANPTVPSVLTRLISGVSRICTYPWVHDAATVPAGGFSPTGLLNAYDITPLRAKGVNGAGETVVFPEIDGVDRVAINQYAKLYRLPPFNLTIHGPTLSSGDEATMDVEVVHAIAPKARLVVYDFNGKVSNSGWISETQQMVQASAGDIISSSVGSCDGTYNSTDAADYASVLAQGAAAGTAMFASTGDNGAYDCIGHGQTPSSTYIGVDMPAALPYVTAVGGTRLSVDQGGAWLAETAWEDPIETAGGGGGISRFFRQPSWQQARGVSFSDQINTNQMRMTPDVSADADPESGAEILFPEGAGQGGGTSQATPIWAGIAALIDQYLRQTHHQQIGFMNPALYYLARTNPPYAPFHDITLGTNLFYSAGRGYDMATGLGSPMAWNLARDLVQYQASRNR